MRHIWPNKPTELVRKCVRRASRIACALVVLPALSCSSEADGEDRSGPPQATTRGAGGGMFPGTEDEWIVAMVDCLNAAGWDAEPDFVQHGFRVPSVTSEQSEEFLRVRDGCEREIGQLPEEPPLTAAQIGDLYDYFVNQLTPCLTSRGYQVDAPPSRDAFVENYYKGGWHPYLNVDPPSQEEWEEINRECPQDPDDAR